MGPGGGGNDGGKTDMERVGVSFGKTTVFLLGNADSAKMTTFRFSPK